MILLIIVVRSEFKVVLSCVIRAVGKCVKGEVEKKKTWAIKSIKAKIKEKAE